MMTPSFRRAVAGLTAITSTMLWAAAPGDVNKPAENVALPEHRAPAREEPLSIRTLLTPYVGMEQLDARLREQAQMLTERLNAAIELELEELLAPKLDIQVADGGSMASVAR